VSKLTSNTHSNHAGDVRGDKQQTYLIASFSPGIYLPMYTTAVGQSVNLYGILSTEPLPGNNVSLPDRSHGIPNALVFVWNVDSGLTPVVARMTSSQPDWKGMFMVKLTPEAAGVYNYQLEYDGNDSYQSSWSGAVSLTVTNVVAS